MIGQRDRPFGCIATVTVGWMRSRVALIVALGFALTAPALAKEAVGGSNPAVAAAQNVDPAVASVYFCGRVDAWTEPTTTATPGIRRHEQAGSITIAGRVFPIAAGTQYQYPSLVVVGQPACLDGWIDASGALVQYAAPTGLPKCIGASKETIRRYEPATATKAGVIQLGSATNSPPLTADSFLFPIPAGTVLPADVLTWFYCFGLALDATGRAIVVSATYGGTATKPQLPSTSTR